ncbi:hypothetical protein DAEQUDRAFT_764716 [Daedalea quercina L-15889]|uniref:Uncharacterized protein n=1 Tax=Daedalea quercina L-15889 TaxID=1314783 RepID=A0A165R3G4_9APHY|nr:hypothetical protein DAEQUDRAFT_764716 [Daedalea quercina L-15889]
MHPNLKPENISNYSSLVSALQDHRVRGSFVEDTFRVPRSFGGVLLKPLSPWAGQTRITFESTADVFGGRGLPLSLLQGGMAPGRVLRGASEPVFGNGAPRNTFTLRVSWPGYTQFDSVRQVPIRPGATRLDVAMIVLGQYSRLFERARVETMRDSSRGGWTIGKGAITLSSLVLVAVSNDMDDVFEAEIHVVFNRNDPASMLAELRQ